MRGPLAAALLALALCGAAPAARAVAIEPTSARVIAAEYSLTPPADADARWSDISLPDTREGQVAWYRVEFDAPEHVRDETGGWMLYLPYLYGGGRVWLNGLPIAGVLEASEQLRVRWNRPHLISLPPTALQPGRNVLQVRVAAAHQPSGVMLPRLVVGSAAELQPMFERRFFYGRTVPMVTVVLALVAAVGVLFVWWRRPFESLYGLAGLSALFWGLRTWNFVIDTLPADVWPWWRLLNHASNGGFVVVLCLFGLHLARWGRTGYTIALSAYAVLGPLLYLVLGMGDTAEYWIGKWWTAGLVPVGISSVALAIIAAWRRPKFGIVAIAAAMLVALITGVHDYMVAWRSPLIEAVAPGWTGHRFLLLHYGADLLLLVLITLMVARFLRSLDHVEEVNRTLEARVAERERQVAASYEQIARLQREQAATDERQRIMRDLHDGLGSQLFTSLSRAERGALPPEAMADALRSSIDEMRMAIEALASDEQDFRTAFGNFRFRWDARLREAGIVPTWSVELPDTVLALPPHDALQLLRILQEALTNVLKHAQARHVHVRLRQEGGRLRFEVEDDGCGDAAAAGTNGSGGRGLANMRSRAERLGAQFAIGPGSARGVRVSLEVSIG